MLGWGLAGVGLGWLAFALLSQINAPAWLQARPNLRLALDRILLFVLLVFLLLVALGRDAAILPRWVLAAFIYVSGSRFLAAVWGIVAGVLIAHFHEPIAEKINQLFNALAGSGGKPSSTPPEEQRASWAPPVVLGVILLLAFILALKPDILENIVSFKAGNVEARFAEKSTTIKEAHLSRTSIEDKRTFDQWEDFYAFYAKRDSARAIASEWFDPPGKEPRRSLFLRVWLSHINPIVFSMQCLNKNEELEAARLDVNLAELAAIWQRFLLKLSSPEWITLDETAKFLGDSTKRVEHVRKRARDVDATCMDKAEKKAKEFAEELEIPPYLSARYMLFQLEQARADLKNTKLATPNTYPLTLLDPYVAGAVGELTKFVFGQREKGEFLSRIAGGYPNEIDMIQPGIINLYYQLSDAKVFSDSLWPLDQMIGELDRARDGAIYIISQSGKKAEADKAAGKDIAGLDKKVGDVSDAYNRNLFLFVTRRLEIYNQRVLSGEHLSEFHKQDWEDALSQLTAILHARTKFPTRSFDGLPVTRIDDATAARWPSIRVDYLNEDFNAYMAAGLSAILRHKDGGAPSAEACAAANYFIARAETEIGEMRPRLCPNKVRSAIPEQNRLAVDDLVRGACAQTVRASNRLSQSSNRFECQHDSH